MPQVWKCTEGVGREGFRDDRLLHCIAATTKSPEFVMDQMNSLMHSRCALLQGPFDLSTALSLSSLAAVRCVVDLLTSNTHAHTHPILP